VNLDRVEQAKRNVVAARARLDGTMGALQQRLRPGNLAGEAWDGVKDKSADLADGALQAVRKRPAAVSVAVGALALFLARDPLKRGLARLVAGSEEEAEEGRIESTPGKLNKQARVARTKAKEGVV
jgi:hypothetical protein